MIFLVLTFYCVNSHSLPLLDCFVLSGLHGVHPGIVCPPTIGEIFCWHYRAHNHQHRYNQHQPSHYYFSGWRGELWITERRLDREVGVGWRLSTVWRETISNYPAQLLLLYWRLFFSSQLTAASERKYTRIFSPWARNIKYINPWLISEKYCKIVSIFWHWQPCLATTFHRDI